MTLEERRRRQLLATGARTIEQIATDRGLDIDDAYAWVNGHRDEHRLFIVDVDGVWMVPDVLLDAEGEPRPELQQLIEPLAQVDDSGWAVWSFLVSPSAELTGDVPEQVARRGPDLAAAAAPGRVADSEPPAEPSRPQWIRKEHLLAGLQQIHDNNEPTTSADVDGGAVGERVWLDEETFRRRWEERIRTQREELRRVPDSHIVGDLIDWFEAADRDGVDSHWRHYEERRRRIVEFGCVFDDDEDELEPEAYRAVATPALLLGTIEPIPMRPAPGLTPSAYSGGLGEHGPVLFGVCVPVRPDRKDVLYELERSRRLRNISLWPSLEDLVAYHEHLTRYGLTCHHGYTELGHTGWFPIDLDALDLLADPAVTEAADTLDALAGRKPQRKWVSIAAAVWPDFAAIHTHELGVAADEFWDWQKDILKLVIVTD